MPHETAPHCKDVVLEPAPADTATAQQQKDACIDKIVAASELEVPQALVDEALKMLTYQLQYQLKYQGMACGDYSYLMQEDTALRMEALKAEAAKQVKTDLVLQGIIESEHLTVTRAELEAEAEAIAVRQKMPLDQVRDFLGPDLASLRQDLLVQKAIDFLCASAVIP